MVAELASPSPRTVLRLFRLRVKLRSESYPRGVCAASRCRKKSVVVVATRKDWPDDVPLCDRHWDCYCDWQDNKHEEERHVHEG